MSTTPISVLIPTRNEEANIHKCINTVSWADDIWVVDSHSTDNTVGIAKSLGAQVVSFTWDGRGPRKKNWALNNLPWKHEWVLIVDADEEVTLPLRDEISEAIARPGYDAYLVSYHYYFLGRLLRHGAPLWKLIVMRRGAACFETIDVPDVTGYDVELHEHPLVRGTTGRLRNRMIHRDLADLHHHFERHNIYSDWEALLRTRYRSRDRQGEVRPRPFGSAMERRRFLKRAFLAVPGKPFVYFFYSYILCAGVLDGRPGLIYNMLKAMYWYQISLKEYEIRHNGGSATTATRSVVA
jgi:glycosyltransferase involved in cell wall biosynthesis